MNRLGWILLLAGGLSAQALPDTTQLPPQQPADTLTTLPSGPDFFPVEDKIDALQNQIDSLKRVIRAYRKQEPMPQLQDDVLQLLPAVEFKQRITLQNGTVVSGTILQEQPDQLTVATPIGRLVLDRKFVVKIDENEPLAAHLELAGEPVRTEYPDHELIRGTVINNGERPAHFVRVIANYWTATTNLLVRDSSFVQGKETTFDNGVISDTSIDPGEQAAFIIEVAIPDPDQISYRTYDIHWEP